VPAVLDRLIAALLAGLLAWAAIGFAELAFAAVPWPRLSNPLFSTAMLVLQWSVVAAAAVTFLAGWFARWPRLRRAMAGWYALMAAICAWQTFFILEHDTRFVAMAVEYAEYLAILAWLWLSPHVAARIGPARVPATVAP
jgi:hypothetical protein